MASLRSSEEDRVDGRGFVCSIYLAFPLLGRVRALALQRFASNGGVVIVAAGLAPRLPDGENAARYEVLVLLPDELHLQALQNTVRSHHCLTWL